MQGLMGGLYVVSEWVMRFAVTNLLWLLFNLPIVLLVMNALFAEQAVGGFLLLLPLAVLAPFLFFPATAAMFACVRDWTLHKEGRSLLGSYWGYYKENYKQSMFGGLLLTALWVVWVVDYYYLSMSNIIFMFAFLFMGALLFVYSLNFFSIIVHYQLKLRALLKKTLILTIGSPVLSLAVFIGSGMILYVSINGPLFLIPFFTGSLIAFLSFSAFYRLYVKLTTDSKKEQ